VLMGGKILGLVGRLEVLHDFKWEREYPARNKRAARSQSEADCEMVRPCRTAGGTPAVPVKSANHAEWSMHGRTLVRS